MGAFAAQVASVNATLTSEEKCVFLQKKSIVAIFFPPHLHSAKWLRLNTFLINMSNSFVENWFSMIHLFFGDRIKKKVLKNDFYFL